MNNHMFWNALEYVLACISENIHYFQGFFGSHDLNNDGGVVS